MIPPKERTFFWIFTNQIEQLLITEGRKMTSFKDTQNEKFWASKTHFYLRHWSKFPLYKKLHITFLDTKIQSLEYLTMQQHQEKKTIKKFIQTSLIKIYAKSFPMESFKILARLKMCKTVNFSLSFSRDISIFMLLTKLVLVYLKKIINKCKWSCCQLP